MGCDIHYVIEKNTGGKWLGVMSTDNLTYEQWPKPRHRDYRFFAEIANVRGESSLGASANPKGAPEDISDLTEHCLARWEGDAHSESWLSAKDFCDAWVRAQKAAFEYWSLPENNKYTNKENEDKNLKEFNRIAEFPLYHLLGIDVDEDSDDDDAKYRVVFWFDN